MPDEIEIDTSLSAEAAVRDYRLATERLSESLRAEASTCSAPEYEAAMAQTKRASREQTIARVNAQYAIKRATGLFPYELALMGL